MFQTATPSPGSASTPFASAQLAAGLIALLLSAGCAVDRSGLTSSYIGPQSRWATQPEVDQDSSPVASASHCINAPEPTAVRTTIRSQNSVLAGGWSGLSSEPTANSTPPSEDRSSEKRQIGAHSLAPVRVRLGRPAFNPESPVPAATSHDDVHRLISSSSVESQATTRSQVEPAAGPTIISRQETTGDAYRALGPVPAVPRSIPAASEIGPDRPMADRNLSSNIGVNVETRLFPGPTDSVVSLESGIASGESISDPERSQRLPPPVPEWTQANRTQESQSPDSVAASPSSTAQVPPIPSAESRPNQASVAPLSIEAEPVPTPEDVTAPSDIPVARTPTMFERLRDLYSPTRDAAAADRFRKQFRRIPDPLGLLREPEVGPDPTLPQQVAELPDTRPPEGSPSILDSGAEAAQRQQLQPFIADLTEELRLWPRDAGGNVADYEAWRRKQTDLRLLWLVAGQSADAVSVIESLPTDEQEFWQAMMLAMTYYREEAADGRTREDQLQSTANQLRAAFRHVQALTDVSIRRVAFCSNINSFGNVDVFPTADFTTGQPVLVYVEVDNLRSERTSSGTYRSECSAVLEILRDGDDQPVETLRIPTIVDESTTQRSDYFQGFELTIPSHLEPGHYSVNIRLTDVRTRRQCDAVLNFNVR